MIKFIKKNKILWILLSYILRINYTFFWKYRRLNSKKLEDSFKIYLEDEILIKFFEQKSNNKLKIVELGCGYGLRLFNLQKTKRNFELIGYDINKKYINFAQNYSREKNINIKFLQSKIEDIVVEEDIDYLISSFTLIYVKKNNLINFFLKNKEKIKKGFIFIEYHSEDKSRNLSYYVHNYKEIFEDCLPKFKIEYEKINNKRWIKSDHEAYKIQGYIYED